MTTEFQRTETKTPSSPALSVAPCSAMPTPEQDAFRGVCMMCAGYREIPTFDGDGNETGTESCPQCDGTGHDNGPNTEATDVKRSV